MCDLTDLYVVHVWERVILYDPCLSHVVILTKLYNPHDPYKPDQAVILLDPDPTHGIIRVSHKGKDPTRLSMFLVARPVRFPGPLSIFGGDCPYEKILLHVLLEVVHRIHGGPV